MRPEAGWYPDPTTSNRVGSDQLRWWDGNAWTSQTRSAEGAQPAVPPVEEEAAPERPSFTKREEPVAPAPAEPPGVQPAYYQPQAYQPTYQTAYPQQQAYYPATPEAPTGPGGAPLGNVWLRLLARLVDGLIVTIVTTIAVSPFFGDYMQVVEQYVVPAAGRYDFQAVMDSEPYQNIVRVALFTSVAMAIIYEGGMLRFKGATIGKLICGLKVVSRTGEGLSTWQAIARPLVPLLLGRFTLNVFTFLDAIWCLFNNSRRTCLHDLMFRTQVISTRR